MSDTFRTRDFEKLMQLLGEARKEYGNYISNAQIFRHARRLRSINQQVLDLITCQTFNPAHELKSGLDDLKEHLQDWSFHWDKERDAQNPKDSDPFVFTGYRTYPKHLDEVLTDYSKKIFKGSEGE